MSKSNKKYSNENTPRRYIDKKSCHSKSRNKDKELNRMILRGDWSPDWDSDEDYDYEYDEDNY